MKVFITGGTGFIGSLISQSLAAQGHDIAILTRMTANKKTSPGISLISGDYTVEGEWQNLPGKYDAVINLAGASIFRRWTPAARQLILKSRIDTTQNIVNALLKNATDKTTLINISGIGYYGHHDREELDETAPPGKDFLAQLALKWEEAALKAGDYGIRVIICRLGHVLGTGGGMIPRLITLSRLHLGGYWGSGNQYISWIHEKDVCHVFSYLLQNVDISGAVNVTAPNPVSNKEFMAGINKYTGSKPLFHRIPDYILKIVAGEFSTVFINGQRALPSVLMKRNFEFDYPELPAALSNLIT